RQRHPACAEKGADRVGSRPAINIGQVVLRRERRMAAKVLMGSLLQKPVKHPRPDLGVDACRVGNNAIEIKQCGVEPRAHEFDAVGRVSHCDKAVLLRSVAISLPTEPLLRSCHGEAFHPVARFASITRIQAAPPLMLLPCLKPSPTIVMALLTLSARISWWRSKQRTEIYAIVILLPMIRYRVCS